jgi:O-antigen/teichoic acid export membrane protein
MITSGQDSLKINTIANLVGRFWAMLLAIALVPVYVRYLGIESYGLVGLLGALQGMFGMFDLGIGAALNREMARLSVVNGSEPEQRNLLRTLEVIYWGLAALVAGVSVLLAPFIATKWINAVALSPETITDCIRLMGFCIASQFVFGFYQGGLMGLQRQVMVNWILILVASVRGAGAVLLLVFVSRRIEVFFLWQLISVAIGALATMWLIWRVLRHDSVPRFSSAAFRSTWKFALGWYLNSVFNVILAQSDKIILSKLLPLDYLGYYTLGQTLVQPLVTVTGAVCAAVFPRFNQLVQLKNTKALSVMYHKAAQFLTLLLVPLSITLILYSWDILLVWTRDLSVADNVYLIVKYLAVGAFFAGIYTIPGYLQLAHNSFGLVLGGLVVLSCLYVSLLIFMVPAYNANGAALSSAIIGFCYLLSVPLMHRRFLQREFGSWLLRDVTFPALAAGASGMVVKAILPQPTGNIGSLLVMTGACCLAAVGSAFLVARVKLPRGGCKTPMGSNCATSRVI